MTTRTRYFVIASLLVLFVGVGTGLVAYYAGFPGGLAGQPGIDDLRFLPRSTRLVAFANVRGVMDSELRQKLRAVLPFGGNEQRQFAEETGVNFDTDIDQVVAGIAPQAAGQQLPASVIVVAHGRFDTGRIEALMLRQGAQLQQYKGARLLVATHQSNESFAVAFVEPGIAAFGNAALIRSAIDQKTTGGGATENPELMGRLRSFASGDAWAVGQFDELMAQAHLPQGFAQQLPPITWFAANAQVDTGLRTTLQAETRDQQGADNLRDVIRGIVALGKLELSSQPPAMKGFLDSLALGGTGTTVSLSFNLPADVVDVLGAAASGFKPEAAPGK